MSLKVTIVNGPRRAGKTTVIERVVKEICGRAPHYVRLAALDGTKKPPPDTACRNGYDCRVATATWVNYDPHRSFEAIADVLTAVEKKDRDACAIMEADTDPGMRHAYPYDCSVFVMPAPSTVNDVFRTREEAERALHLALNDTGAFAGEIYGLMDDDSSVDGSGPERPDMSDSQIITLMRSPLGQELASRIECRPDYHGVMESDVVVVNTGIGGTSLAVDEVVRRLERLGCRLGPDGSRKPAIFCCDPCDEHDPRRQKLFEHFQRFYQ